MCLAQQVQGRGGGGAAASHGFVFVLVTTQRNYSSLKFSVFKAFVAQSLVDTLIHKSLRWLDTVFQGQYLSSLSINYVAINKVLEKLASQLY